MCVDFFEYEPEAPSPQPKAQSTTKKALIAVAIPVMLPGLLVILLGMMAKDIIVARKTMLTVMVLLLTVTTAQADEVRVKQWPMGVPCSALNHKSDGSWALAKTVIGPDDTWHYPNPSRESYDNRMLAKQLGPRCERERLRGDEQQQ